ncbi:FHA domain-containing protein [Nanoarchaeota archaeon]
MRTELKDNITGRIHPLTKDKTTIGRSNDNDIVTQEGDSYHIKKIADLVSRTHAVVISDEGRHFLVDNGSTNGTYVLVGNVKTRRLEKGEKYPLEDEDTFSLGSAPMIGYSFGYVKW